MADDDLEITDLVGHKLFVSFDKRAGMKIEMVNDERPFTRMTLEVNAVEGSEIATMVANAARQQSLKELCEGRDTDGDGNCGWTHCPHCRSDVVAGAPRVPRGI